MSKTEPEPIIVTTTAADVEMASLWPEMPEDQLRLWVTMPEARKSDAVRRLRAINNLERVDGRAPVHESILEAAKAAGVSRSGFYAIVKRWKAAPSLDALGVNVSKDGPGRTAQIEQRHRMLDRVRVLLDDDPEIGSAEIRRRLGESFGTTPAFATVRRLILDAQRVAPPKSPFGRRVVLDSPGLDVHYSDGIPVRLYVLLDAGTDLILGWSIWSHGDAVGGYVRAIDHALSGKRSSRGRKSVGNHGLSTLNLSHVQAEVPESIELHILPKDLTTVGPFGAFSCVQVVADKSLGRLTIDAVGERLGNVWIGAGYRESGWSYRTGRIEDMPTLTPDLERRIDDVVHDHNLRRLSLMPRDAGDDPAAGVISQLRTLLAPVTAALSADGYGEA